MVREVKIVQGTPEWHIWRQKGVGASDVAAIFGESPYKTKRDLWFEKSGFGDSDDEDKSYVFRLGHETESEIRELFHQHTQIEIRPTCFERDEIFLASLDGYDKTLGILEAKLVGRDALKRAAEMGEIPRHHWIQVQSQLFASDSDKAFWGAKAPKVKDGVVVEIGRDEGFIKKLECEVLAFWDSLKSNTPPPLSAQDTLFITDPEQAKLFEALAKLKTQKDIVDTAYAQLEAQVKALAVHAKVKCGGISITEAERAGSIDYLKVPEIQALDSSYLERFRKKSTRYKTIRFSGGEK